MKRLISQIINTILSRLFYKMLIIYSLLTLIPLAIVSYTFYERSSSLIERKAAEDAQRGLEDTVNRVDDTLFAINKWLIDIGEHQIIQRLLPSAIEEGLTIATVEEFLRVELRNARKAFGPIIDNIYILEQSDIVYSALPGELQFGEAFRIMPFQFNHMPEWAFFTDHRRMACVINLFPEGSSAVTGETRRLIVTLDENQVREFYEDYEQDSFYITNSDNLILSANEPEWTGKLLDIRDTANRIVLKTSSRYADYYYVHLASAGTGTVARQQAIFSIAVMIASWLAILFVTFVVLKRVTTPIQRLQRLMRGAEIEDYRTIQGIVTKDEIGMICAGYNHLVERTRSLIEDNYKQELIIREAELKAIRMYINPHFLYNTMEFISIMSSTPEKAKHIPRMIRHLSDIFRYSIAPGNAFVTLEAELEITKKYLDIHKFRYGDRLACDIHVPDLLLSLRVPKLILQPLAENAIIHGIDRLTGGGNITIRAYEEDYCLVMEIENSSSSGSRDKLSQRVVSKGLGSGIEVVRARLKHHYGDGYDVSLIYHPQVTIARIIMPMDMGLHQEGDVI